MDINADQLLENAIRDGVRDGIKRKFGQSYNNPMEKMIEAAIERHRTAIVSLISDSIAAMLDNTDFREQIKSQVASQLSKQLVQKFGGELEKQVNTLKSDPATRARITLAIDSIVSGKS